MKTLRGVVERGSGVATGHLQEIEPRISQRIGLPSLHPGTLNVRLPEGYIVRADAVIERHEYKNRETIKLQRCRLKGIRCCIMRPITHEGNKQVEVLEIMSEYPLRDHLKLCDGDQVEVEVEGEDAWWAA
jgi:CTP-dependent riboflavin kinase